MTATMRTAYFISITGLTTHFDFANYGYPNIGRLRPRSTTSASETYVPALGQQGIRIPGSRCHKQHSRKLDAYIPEGLRSDVQNSLSLLLSLAREGILKYIEGGEEEEEDCDASQLGRCQCYAASLRGQTYSLSGSTQIPKLASKRWLDFLPERQATARYLIGAAMAVSFISGTTIVSAEVKTVPDRQTRQAYEARLSSEATKGTYTASDGGISALRLMEQCGIMAHAHQGHG